MNSSRRHRAIRAAGLAGLFAAGFLCGSLAQRPASAQIGDAMKKAGESGALGPAGQLGSSILEMQDHVTALQKNLDTLKKVKDSLGG
jgi:hypothetical protein